jgi:hypothetical protein
VSERYNKYFRECPFPRVDIYRVLLMFGVTDPCLQHAVKKLLLCGLRTGGKSVDTEVGIMVAEGDDLPTAVRREVKRLKGTHWKDEQGQWVLSDEQAIRADAAREERERAFRDGYQAGFYATGEGHNGEYVSPNCTQAELDEDREIAVAKYTAAAPIVTDADPAQEALAKRIDAKLREGGEP